MPPTLEAVEQHHRSKAATGGGGASRPTSFSGGAPAPLAGRRTQTDPSRPTSFSAGKKAAGYTPSSASEEKAEASGKGAIVANLQAHKNKMGKEYSEKDDDDVYELRVSSFRVSSMSERSACGIWAPRMSTATRASSYLLGTLGRWFPPGAPHTP